MYDPSIGRFMTVDPLAEWNFKITPYHYCQNDPINRIDPNGMQDTTKTNMLPEVVVIAPRKKDVVTNNESDSNFLSVFLRWLHFAPQGSHNPRNVREASKWDNFVLRNFDQNEVRNIGGAFGDPFYSWSMLNNYVTNGDYYQGRKPEEATSEVSTSDEKIKKQMDKTDATGKQIKELQKPSNIDTTYSIATSYPYYYMDLGPFSKGDTMVRILHYNRQSCGGYDSIRYEHYTPKKY